MTTTRVKNFRLILGSDLCECYWTSDDGQSDMLAGVGPTPSAALADAQREISEGRIAMAGGRLCDGEQISGAAWLVISDHLYALGHETEAIGGAPGYTALVETMRRLCLAHGDA